MSDKPWDADAELGSGRTLDFGGKPDDLGGSTLKLPETPVEVAAEPPAPAEPTRRGPTIRPNWIILLVVLAALAGPLFGVVVAIITAFDDISDSIESFESTDDFPTATENLAFLQTLDAAVSGTASALPQCFFDEAASDLCTSTYGALADLVTSTSVTAVCSDYRAHWVDSLRGAAGGNADNLQALYNDESGAYPPASTEKK